MARGTRGPLKKNMEPLDCRLCPNRQQAEWCALTDEGMEAVNEIKITRNLQRGQFLYMQEQISPGIFCIAKGTLAVSRKEEGTGSILLRLAHAGQTLGFRNVLNHSISITSAKALERCTICHIAGETFTGLLKTNPALEKNFLNRLAKDLAATESTMVELASLPVRSRLARVLMMLAKHYAVEKPANGLELRPPMTWRDISQLIYTRPETLTRTMQAMESDGLFRHKGHSIHIPRLAPLIEEGKAR